MSERWSIRHLLSQPGLDESQKAIIRGGKATKMEHPLPPASDPNYVPPVEGDATPRPILDGPWSILIIDWHPTLCNALMGDWREAHERKKRDADMLGIHIFLFRVPSATRRRRVTLTLTYRVGQTHCDPDAPFKSLLDGLTRRGMLVDDSPKWLELMPLRYGTPGSRRETLIEIEDI